MEAQTDTISASDRNKKPWGFIAFFDILGYKSFLEVSDDAPSETVDGALKAIAGAKAAVLEWYSKASSSGGAEILKQFQWLIFSDTIMITSRLLQDSDLLGHSIDFSVLCITSSVLQRFMFDSGLPLRGAITHGNFIISTHEEGKHCFAGKPIVDAYLICNTLDLAACVISDKTVKELETIDKKETSQTPALSFPFLYKYKIPLNTRAEHYYSVVFPALINDSTKHWANMDVKEIVVESFWAYGKQLRQIDYSKVTNTELLLRFLKMKQPDGFK